METDGLVSEDCLRLSRATQPPPRLAKEAYRFWTSFHLASERLRVCVYISCPLRPSFLPTTISAPFPSYYIAPITTMAKRKASVGNALEYDAVRLELENSTHHLRNVRRRVTSPPLHQGPNSDMQLQPLTFTNTDEDMEMDIEPTVTQSGAGGYSNMNIGQDSNSHNLVRIHHSTITP